MVIPGNIYAFLQRMEAAGYEAYLVGGCVRDMLMGKMPHDWDITTSARPEQVLRLFDGYAVPTGLQHGTVTVLWQDFSLEVTTFRTETTYQDHRHPDAVAFADTLEEDLSRRDFTVNAMAMDCCGHLIDLYGGQSDLCAGLLRCVGDPDKRFSEDALRIMRCLRFAATLGFSVAPATESAMHTRKEDLSFVSAERLRDELCKLICGKHVGRILLDNWDILGVMIPEILPCVGFDQQNHHHIYDVWEHIARSVDAVPPTPVLRLCMLFHDIGKPACFSADEQGVGHFYGHAAKSAEMAENICRRLRFDNETAHKIVTLVRWHDREVLCTPSAVKRALNRLGAENFRNLAEIKRSDNLAQNPAYRGRLQEIDAVMALAEQILSERACFSLKQLAVNGNDLMALGLQGRDVGNMLNALLEKVMDGELPNEEKALLHWVQTQNG